MFSLKLLSPKTLTFFLLPLMLAVGAAAQEPQPKVEPERPPAATPEQKPATPAAQPKQDPERKPEAVTPVQKSTKPEPERKGGLQNAEATRAELEKGSTANLGTDIAAVRQRIETALQSDPALKGTAFNLNVTDDTIEITGVANNGRDRTAARRIVQSFAGNLRVKDRITVAGAAPPSTPENASPDQGKPKTQAEADADTLAKPESDETQSPQKKANKPKKEPAKHGDQAEEPRRKN
jgi:hypothetical protein